MSIQKKFFLTLVSILTTVLLVSYFVIYIIFNRVLSEEISNYQNTVITINKNLITSFMDSIKQTTLQLVTDEPIGEYLSKTIDDPLELIIHRQKIENQFTNHLTSQITTSNNYYRNTLFLNNSIPISSSFQTATLDLDQTARMSNIYNDTDVKNTTWYKNTLASPRNYYVFINENTNEFCYAKKIINNYYTGPYDPDGIGVLVIGIHLDEFEKVLSFSPITPNSSFVLLNQNNDILYQSSQSISSQLFLQLTDKSINQNKSSFDDRNNMITQDGKKYVTNVTQIDWGLSLVFLTPYSDIQNQISSRMNFFILFSFFIMILISALAFMISKRTTEPIIKLSKAIKLVDDTRTFDLDTLKVSNDKEILILCTSFEELILKVNSLIDDIKIEDEKQKLSELRALQAQINPHFIFNAMDVVNWIALSKNEDEIANIVSSISNLMRYSITDPDHMIQIEQEVLNIKEFISIYKLRYNNEIQMDIHTNTSLNDVYIPKFTLQPLIENSITHGIEDPNICLNIEVNIQYEYPMLTIEVSDNGKGCRPEQLNDYLSYKPTNLKVSNGFGIRNLNERIHLSFRENSGLSYYLDKDNHLVAKIQMDFSSYQKKNQEDGFWDTDTKTDGK